MCNFGVKENNLTIWKVIPLQLGLGMQLPFCHRSLGDFRRPQISQLRLPSQFWASAELIHNTHVAVADWLEHLFPNKDPLTLQNFCNSRFQCCHKFTFFTSELKRSPQPVLQGLSPMGHALRAWLFQRLSNAVHEDRWQKGLKFGRMARDWHVHELVWSPRSPPNLKLPVLIGVFVLRFQVQCLQKFTWKNHCSMISKFFRKHCIMIARNPIFAFIQNIHVRGNVFKSKESGPFGQPVFGSLHQ